MDNIMSNNYGHKPILAPIKVFTCKYCGRKFLNSRALGGHQNAHKKERTIWMTSALSNQKSIGIETHSLFKETVQEGFSTGKSVQSLKKIEDSWKKQKLKEMADQDWHGSFHVESSDSNGQDSGKNDELDLDLRL